MLVYTQSYNGIYGIKRPSYIHHMNALELYGTSTAALCALNNAYNIHLVCVFVGYS